jgi:hypothetical protein
MITRSYLNEKNTPMTKPAVYAEAPTDFAADAQPARSRSNTMHLIDHLINEALARARMRSPQNINSEAHRSALRIAIKARQQQAREMGNLSQYGVR